MIEVPVPGASLRIEHVVLDVNGTIAVDGVLLPGVAGRMAELKERVHVLGVTAATHGPIRALADELGIEMETLQAGAEAERKLSAVRALGAESVAAIGNGANDRLMLEACALGIAVLGREGTSVEAVLAAKVLAPDIATALDLLLVPQRLVATLRR